VELLSAGTIQAALAGRWRFEPQQLGERGGSGLMHRRTHRHFDGFQVQPPGLTAVREHDA
jgi:hypothetical protein